MNRRMLNERTLSTGETGMEEDNELIGRINRINNRLNDRERRTNNMLQNAHLLYMCTHTHTRTGGTNVCLHTHAYSHATHMHTLTHTRVRTTHIRTHISLATKTSKHPDRTFWTSCSPQPNLSNSETFRGDIRGCTTGTVFHSYHTQPRNHWFARSSNESL